MALCEAPCAEAVALVQGGMCHAAIRASAGRHSAPPPHGLIALPLADCDVCVVVPSERSLDVAAGDAMDVGARVAVGPQGSAARTMLDAAKGAGGASGIHLVEVRSDAAALAAAAGGAADCAAATMPAARNAGLSGAAIRRVSVALLLRRDLVARDPAARTLQAMRRSPQFRAALTEAGYAVPRPWRRVDGQPLGRPPHQPRASTSVARPT